MNQSEMIEASTLLMLQAKFNSNRIGFGKCRITRRKANYRVVRKNRQMITRDSRRANR